MMGSGPLCRVWSLIVEVHAYCVGLETEVFALCSVAFVLFRVISVHTVRVTYMLMSVLPFQ